MKPRCLRSVSESRVCNQGSRLIWDLTPGRSEEAEGDRRSDQSMSSVSLLQAPGIGFCRDIWGACRRLPRLGPGLQHLSTSSPPVLAEGFLVSTTLHFCNTFVQGPLVRILDLEDDSMTEIWKNMESNYGGRVSWRVILHEIAQSH